MSKRTQLNKGQSAVRKAIKKTLRGNFWVPTTNTTLRGRVYKNVKPVRFTPMEPLAAMIAKMARKKKKD